MAKYGMHSLFGSRKVVKVVLNQTWPHPDRRPGMIAFAKLEKDGRISLHDTSRKRFYDNAVQGEHFVSQWMAFFGVEHDPDRDLFEQLGIEIDETAEPMSEEDFRRKFGMDPDALD